MSKIKRLKWLIFFISAVGGFVAMLDSDTVNLALYQISEAFNIDFADAQWIVTIYILILSAFLIFFGKLNDLISRRKLYAGGYLLFALGALLNMAAGSFVFLIISRIIQALGGSILLANNHAIVSSVFKGKQRARALGFSTALMALAGMSGPVIGGFFLSFLNWRLIFLPSVIIGLIGAFFAFKYIPTTVKKRAFRFDYIGTLLLFFAITSLILIISQGYIWGWTSKIILALIVSFFLFAVLFIAREKRTDMPLVDLNLFRSKIFAHSNIAIMLAYFSSYANVLLFPYYTQIILGLSAIQTAFLMLPFSFMSMLSALLNGKLIKNAESSELMILGMVYTVGGFLFLVPISENLSYFNLILAQCLIGAGAGCFHPNVNNLILSTVPKNKMGVSSGILSLFRNVGKLLGITISISVFNLVQKTELSLGTEHTQAILSGYRAAILGAILFGLICMLLSYKTHKIYLAEKNK
ncbi:MAG: MFS transporter [Candidatus Gastranaerophilales bacterium]|nr:MFS transporter [Candidatus Gastranaerophilales bacterium]